MQAVYNSIIMIDREGICRTILGPVTYGFVATICDWWWECTLVLVHEDHRMTVHPSRLMKPNEVQKYIGKLVTGKCMDQG